MAKENVEEQHPKFVSTSGQAVHLSLLSGHTAAVGTKPTPLHPRFHRAAVLEGCVPEGFDTSHGINLNEKTEKTRSQVLLDAISKMVEEATDDPTLQAKLFTGDGRPDAVVLAARCGFQVRAQERDAAWEAYGHQVEADS